MHSCTSDVSTLVTSEDVIIVTSDCCEVDELVGETMRLRLHFACQPHDTEQRMSESEQVSVKLWDDIKAITCAAVYIDFKRSAIQIMSSFV